MQYLPPGGVVGTAAAKLFGEEPEKQIENDLCRFKQLMESSAPLDNPSVASSSFGSNAERFSEKREAASSNEPT
jgi:uncharacterized membrane protein